jgi:hypothetical protein
MTTNLKGESKKTKLYVGCSLTGASEEFKSSVEELKHKLRGEGYEVFDFVGLVAGTSADVYNWDIVQCVRNCDALIGICDFPSIGLGYELSEATRLKKPVLAIAHNDSLVTRLVLGAAEVETNFRFERYAQIDTTINLINKWLGENNLTPETTAAAN